MTIAVDQTEETVTAPPRPPTPVAPSSNRKAVGATSLVRSTFARAMVLMVLALSAGALLQVLVVGRVQHTADQQQLFDRFRARVAAGTLPLGATDGEGREVAIGTPVAYLEVPSIGLKQVVVEGTTAGATFLGPGHRRDTVLPGQIGTSMVFGRRSMFGGPFSELSRIKANDVITVTTGQGVFTYRAIGARSAGDPLPAPVPRGGSRLTLVTASGAAFVPSGVLYVDADLDGSAVGPGPRLISSATLPGEEQPLAGDARTLWALILWMQALIIMLVCALWSWLRWGRAQTWIVFAPSLLLVSVMAWGEFARLIPNLA